LPLGDYRIVEQSGGLKSDLLGSASQDPDVQPFEYSFTLSQ